MSRNVFTQNVSIRIPSPIKKKSGKEKALMQWDADDCAGEKISALSFNRCGFELKTERSGQ